MAATEDQLARLSKVKEIITKASQELKSIEVNREIELEFDVGNLLVTDKNTIDEEAVYNPDTRPDYLQSLARDGVQALMNKVWDLPSHTEDNAVFVSLPKPTTILPREKPVPKEKALTKWEQFARDKGLTKRKKDKKVWDHILKRWVPRFGMKKVQAEKEKNWVKEVPGNVDPYEDMFAKEKELKRERVAKNEYQRLRNIAKSRKLKVPNVGVTGNDLATSKDLGVAMHHSRFATASRGKFQPTLPNEQVPKGLGKKRRHEQTTGDGRAEKKRYLEVLKKVEKNELNLSTAVHKQIREENIEADLSKKGGKKQLRRSKAGGRHRTRSDHRASKLGMGIHESRKQKITKIKAKQETGGLGLGKGRRMDKTGGKGKKG
ncbi:ribosome biogenesis regulatory protein homolog [Penaeus chinensis]|uniref:ribosome biogenesis regulatory protein homolog n=1 Tax=Penaeus chinensis TaxID=139456 RepID=UPI001FB5C3A2|nr:ribosome biogenesis regulatory protein homolog [Penaeus chinensis]